MSAENYSTTKELLINTEVPIESRTYKPFSHGRVIDLTLEAISKAGLVLDKELYTSSKEGMVATGKYTIKTVADNEMQLQIAWLNSYNKTKRLTYGIGSQVFICQNGCISADMGFFKKKHQGEIVEFTPIAISEYIRKAQDTFVALQRERERMKEIELSRRVVAELLGRAVVEDEFITTTQLNIIKRELDSPTHDYGAPNSIWELYQFVSFSMKDIHPSLWMSSHIDAHRFFMGVTESYTEDYYEDTSIIIPSTEDKRQLKLFPEIFG